MQKSKLQFKNQNWEMVLVDDFFDKLPVPKQYEKRDVVTNGKVPVIDQSLDGIYGYHNNKPDFLASSEDPLITFANHTCHVRFITFNFSVIQNVFPLRAKEGVDPKFLYFSILNKISPEGYKGHWPKFKALILPKPPIKIQKRIVTRIEELFEKIDKAKELRKKTQEETAEIFSSALQEVFSKAEKKWGISNVLNISEKLPQYGYTESAREVAIGPKFLRITDIQDGKVDWDKVPYCKCSNKDFEKYKLKKDDILFARTGATTGKTYLVKECPVKTVFASYLIRLRGRKEKALSEYVYVFFQSPQYWCQVIPYGGAQPNMNAQLLSKIKIPLPPLSEQKKIVAYFDNLQKKVESLKQLQQNQSEELTELKQSILSKAFTPVVEQGSLRGKKEN